MMTRRSPLLVLAFAGAFFVGIRSASADEEFTTLTSKFRDGCLSVAFSPGGAYLAAAGGESGSPEGVVTLWDVESGELLARIDDFPTQCGSLHFHPTGQLLAVACGDRSIHVLRQVSVRPRPVWKHVARLPRRRHPRDRLIMPDFVRFSPDGGWLACSAYGLDFSTHRFRGLQIEIWSATERAAAPAQTLQAFKGMVTGMRFLDEHGDRLLTAETGDATPVLRVFSLGTGEMESAVPVVKAASGYQPVLDVSNDYRQVAVGGRGFLALLETENLEQMRYLVAEEEAPTFSGVSFSPDGKILASCDENAIRLWDVRSGEPIATREQEMSMGVAFSPDGSRLATIAAQHDGVRLWDVSRLIESGKSE